MIRRITPVVAALALTGCGAATAEKPSTPSPAPPATATPDSAKDAEDALNKAIADAEQQIKKNAADGCTDLVTDNLKAPATAQFTGMKVRKKGEVYVVTGYVDAENGFGALMRLDYRCSVRNARVHLDRLHQPE